MSCTIFNILHQRNEGDERTYKEKNGNFESQMNDGECDCDGSQCQSQCCTL